MESLWLFRNTAPSSCWTRSSPEQKGSDTGRCGSDENVLVHSLCLGPLLDDFCYRCPLDLNELVRVVAFRQWHLPSGPDGASCPRSKSTQRKMHSYIHR